MKEEEKAKSVVTFIVGPYRFCIPAIEVLSIITEPVMSKLPWGAGSVEGVFDYHGKVATSVSLRRKLGLEEYTGESDVWILSHISPGLIAFRVDKIMDLVNVGSLQWQQVNVLSPISAVDRFALSDRDIFLSSNCESLFAMQDMIRCPEIVNENHVIEPIEREPETLVPGQVVTDEKRIDNSVPCIADDDMVATGESVDVQAYSVNVSLPAQSEPKSVVSSDSKRDDQLLKSRASVVSRKYRNQSHHTKQNRLRRPAAGTYQNHTTVKTPAIQNVQKTTHRRATIVRPHSVGEMQQNDYDRGTNRKNRVFGLTMFLGLFTVVAILLGAFWLRPDGKNESQQIVLTSPVLSEVESYRDGPAMPGITHYESSTVRSEDNEPDKNSRPSVVQPEIVRPSDPPAGNSVTYDNNKSPTPHELKESKEVLRVETINFTVTVERPPTYMKENKNEIKATAYPDEGVTHIVVKGDTLWDVAEHYLGDPFRYPELAAVSHIRDPDWIYPGDIIRIIKK